MTLPPVSDQEILAFLGQVPELVVNSFRQLPDFDQLLVRHLIDTWDTGKSRIVAGVISHSSAAQPELAPAPLSTFQKMRVLAALSPAVV